MKSDIGAYFSVVDGDVCMLKSWQVVGAGSHTGDIMDAKEMLVLPSRDEMLRATMSRDAAYNGVFFAAVATTRIFCRPTCPARKPNPENISFFPSVRDCLFGGYRPCKRCKPLATNGYTPDWLEGLLAEVERAPAARISDQDLREMEISPHQARRYFSTQFGMTFQAYHRARRLGLALESLRKGKDSLMVGLEHGFESQSGFRDAFEKTFGVPPGKARDVECLTTTSIETPIGPLVACATDEALCFMQFAERRGFTRQLELTRRRLGVSVVPGTNQLLNDLAKQMGEYFRKERREFDVPLHYPGSDFQVSVWDALRRIKIGQTRSYDEMATAIGRPGAWRAVGRANGDNPITIIVPCHRVVRSDGSLGGYGAWVWRKNYLLDLEQAKAGSKGSQAALFP